MANDTFSQHDQKLKTKAPGDQRSPTSQCLPTGHLHSVLPEPSMASDQLLGLVGKPLRWVNPINCLPRNLAD